MSGIVLSASFKTIEGSINDIRVSYHLLHDFGSSVHSRHLFQEIRMCPRGSAATTITCSIPKLKFRESGGRLFACSILRKVAWYGFQAVTIAFADREIVVGMAGTFDVENYGDLLFPIIAEAALKERDQRIKVVPFSVNSRSKSCWPFEVRPMEELGASMSALSAMLIGGGQIVRFDERYPASVPANANMPLAYWLIPAFQAAVAGKPVIWNAVGAYTDSPRAPWYDELLREIFASSHFIGVRDVASQNHLTKLAPEAAIELLPDTAFGLSRLWPLEDPTPEFINWRAALGLEHRYVVVQANAAVAYHRSTIESFAKSMGNIDIVILPVCRCHGDRAEYFPALEGRLFLSREWPAPRLVSEIIGRSEFVFASSLHACITALSYGVPGSRVPMYSDRKFELLDYFGGIAEIGQEEKLSCFIKREHRVEQRVAECADQLDRYWDYAADVILRGPNEHRSLSRTLMLCSMAKVTRRRGHLRRARRFATTLRKIAVRCVPSKQRAVIRHRLFLLKLRGSNMRRKVRIPTAMVAEAGTEKPD